MNENMSQINKSHNLVLLIMTVSCFGGIFEAISQGWELWVVPLIAMGIIACWFFHITHFRETSFRENFYIIFAMLTSFYHGVHPSSFFDIEIISILVLFTAAVMGKRFFMRLVFLEFVILMVGQIVYSIVNKTVVYDSLTISRIMLHFGAEALVYKSLDVLFGFAVYSENLLRTLQKREEAGKEGMEDFLVNISHELRTPVNVINGMSTLILKKETRDDVKSIRDAGLRLSHQIEDIQDYSEIQRGDALLEEEKYMITSVLNDIVMGFNIMSVKKDVEFVIDLDPNVPTLMRGDVKKIKKILTHLIDNAFKYTRTGGICVKVTGTKRDYGFNLVIEVTDTGVGMTENERDKISKGNYQTNKKRNRSTGGIGLGLSLVYGFARLMGGFVTIESTKGRGTTLRVSVVQEVLDASPCLAVETKRFIGIAFHVTPDRFDSPQVREFYKSMASNMAMGLRLNLYSAPSITELKKLIGTGNITHVFMGAYEYEQDPYYFDQLANSEVIVTVAADKGFSTRNGSHVIIMPKPLYGYHCVKILNGDKEVSEFLVGEEERELNLDGVRALIVDDEPMNLVVATGLFREYNMIIDTAESGKEALHKYDTNEYDVVFMDHMMPEMDGVEAMKKMRFIADQKGDNLKIVALTANAISGAREMFLREGFDGFISKPINISDFERVMTRVMLEHKSGRSGGAR